eukprot:GHVQ01026541.1.p1 GENE.GHVQ01026541.1~~GHVQ01026541.1.p1  ORF type:complete len:1994 (+),score=298.64 GHVQ01026541.1:1316-7297(+)
MRLSGLTSKASSVVSRDQKLQAPWIAAQELLTSKYSEFLIDRHYDTISEVISSIEKDHKGIPLSCIPTVNKLLFVLLARLRWSLHLLQQLLSSSTNRPYPSSFSDCASVPSKSYIDYNGPSVVASEHDSHENPSLPTLESRNETPVGSAGVTESVRLLPSWWPSHNISICQIIESIIVHYTETLSRFFNLLVSPFILCKASDPQGYLGTVTTLLNLVSAALLVPSPTASTDTMSDHSSSKDTMSSLLVIPPYPSIDTTNDVTMFDYVDIKMSLEFQQDELSESETVCMSKESGTNIKRLCEVTTMCTSRMRAEVTHLLYRLLSRTYLYMDSPSRQQNVTPRHCLLISDSLDILSESCLTENVAASLVLEWQKKSRTNSDLFTEGSIQPDMTQISRDAEDVASVLNGTAGIVSATTGMDAQSWNVPTGELPKIDLGVSGREGSEYNTETWTVYSLRKLSSCRTACNTLVGIPQLLYYLTDLLSSKLSVLNNDHSMILTSCNMEYVQCNVVSESCEPPRGDIDSRTSTTVKQNKTKRLSSSECGLVCEIIEILWNCIQYHPKQSSAFLCSSNASMSNLAECFCNVAFGGWSNFDLYKQQPILRPLPHPRSCPTNLLSLRNDLVTVIVLLSSATPTETIHAFQDSSLLQLLLYTHKPLFHYQFANTHRSASGQLTPSVLTDDELTFRCLTYYAITNCLSNTDSTDVLQSIASSGFVHHVFANFVHLVYMDSPQDSSVSELIKSTPGSSATGSGREICHRWRDLGVSGRFGRASCQDGAYDEEVGFDHDQPYSYQDWCCSVTGCDACGLPSCLKFKQYQLERLWKTLSVCLPAIAIKLPDALLPDVSLCNFSPESSKSHRPSRLFAQNIHRQEEKPSDSITRRQRWSAVEVLFGLLLSPNCPQHIRQAAIRSLYIGSTVSPQFKLSVLSLQPVSFLVALLDRLRQSNKEQFHPPSGTPAMATDGQRDDMEDEGAASTAVKLWEQGALQDPLFRLCLFGLISTLCGTALQSKQPHSEVLANNLCLDQGDQNEDDSARDDLDTQQLSCDGTERSHIVNDNGTAVNCAVKTFVSVGGLQLLSECLKSRSAQDVHDVKNQSLPPSIQLDTSARDPRSALVSSPRHSVTRDRLDTEWDLARINNGYLETDSKHEDNTAATNTVAPDMDITDGVFDSWVTPSCNRLLETLHTLECVNAIVLPHESTRLRWIGLYNCYNKQQQRASSEQSSVNCGSAQRSSSPPPTTEVPQGSFLSRSDPLDLLRRLSHAPTTLLSGRRLNGVHRLLDVIAAQHLRQTQLQVSELQRSLQSEDCCGRARDTAPAGIRGNPGTKCSTAMTAEGAAPPQPAGSTSSSWHSTNTLSSSLTCDTSFYSSSSAQRQSWSSSMNKANPLPLNSRCLLDEYSLSCVVLRTAVGSLADFAELHPVEVRRAIVKWKSGSRLKSATRSHSRSDARATSSGTQRGLPNQLPPLLWSGANSAGRPFQTHTAMDDDGFGDVEEEQKPVPSGGAVKLLIDTWIREQQRLRNLSKQGRGAVTMSGILSSTNSRTQGVGDGDVSPLCSRHGKTTSGQMSLRSEMATARSASRGRLSSEGVPQTRPDTACSQLPQPSYSTSTAEVLVLDECVGSRSTTPLRAANPIVHKPTIFRLIQGKEIVEQNARERSCRSDCRKEIDLAADHDSMCTEAQDTASGWLNGGARHTGTSGSEPTDDMSLSLLPQHHDEESITKRLLQKSESMDLCARLSVIITAVVFPPGAAFCDDDTNSATAASAQNCNNSSNSPTASTELSDLSYPESSLPDPTVITNTVNAMTAPVPKHAHPNSSLLSALSAAALHSGQTSPTLSPLSVSPLSTQRSHNDPPGAASSSRIAPVDFSQVPISIRHLLPASCQQELISLLYYPYCQSFNCWRGVTESLSLQGVVPVSTDRAWLAHCVSRRHAQMQKFRQVQAAVESERTTREMEELHKFFADFVSEKKKIVSLPEKGRRKLSICMMMSDAQRSQRSYGY